MSAIERIVTGTIRHLVRLGASILYSCAPIGPIISTTLKSLLTAATRAFLFHIRVTVATRVPVVESLQSWCDTARARGNAHSDKLLVLCNPEVICAHEIFRVARLSIL